MKIRIGVLTACLWLSACAGQGAFNDSAANFATATDSLGAETRRVLALTHTIQVDQTLYAAQFGLDTIDKPAITASLFSREDMDARLTALDVLAEYARTLKALAGDTSGGDFTANVASLQASVLQLERKLEKTDRGFVTLSGKTQAVGPLVGHLGGMIITAMQADAIEKAVLAAEAPMRELSQLFDDDVAIVFAKLENAQIRKFSAVSDNFNFRACAAGDTDRSACAAIRKRCDSDDPPRHYCRALREGMPFPQAERSVLAAAARDMSDLNAENAQLRSSYAAAQHGFRSALSALLAKIRAVREGKTIPDAAASISLFFRQAAQLTSDVDKVYKAYDKTRAK